MQTATSSAAEGGPPRQMPLMERLAMFTAPATGEAHPIHGLHPYPAKYIPQLPRAVMREHTNERNIVLDPFCGSGTTLVEAALLGRRSIGIDSNPVATLASRAKTTALPIRALRRAEELLTRVSEADPATLPMARLPHNEITTHWFQVNMARELAWLRDLCMRETDRPLRDFLLCVFSSIVVVASNQDSDTRYKAVEKKLLDGFALGRFASRLSSALPWITDLSAQANVARKTPKVKRADTTKVADLVGQATIDLIITSPPYPNSYDYYLYHKLRMWWLGLDHRPVQRAEIGSRYEHSSRRASLDVFLARMRPVMRGLSEVLKPSKLAYFFVGDSVLAGAHVDMLEVYAELAVEAGLGFVDSTSYELNLVSRSFRNTRESAGGSHGHRQLQHIVVLEGRRAANGSKRPIAPHAASAPVIDLDDVTDGAVVAIASADLDRHIHSLAAYPSKFIPEIPRWAIEHYSEHGELIVDPFGGSGTTGVEALLCGRDALCADLSPYATLTALAKTSSSPEAALTDAALALEAAAAEPARLPLASRLEFPLDDFWFSTDHLSEFARLLAFIDGELPVELNAFFRVVLASTIRAFSFQDPGQIKVKRDPRKVMRGTPSPSELLRARLPAATQRLRQFLVLRDPFARHAAITSSADLFLDRLPPRCVDLLITSPPYINAMNYAMTHRYELVLLGLVEHGDLQAHQAQYFGSERVYARDFNALRRFPEEHVLAEPLNGLLEQIYAKEPKRAYVAFRFFEQMDATAESMVRVVRAGGRIVLIAGSNIIRGVPIDTFQMLSLLLESYGARRQLTFHYQIVKQSFKLRRHATASIIPHDGVAVMDVP